MNLLTRIVSMFYFFLHSR